MAGYKLIDVYIDEDNKWFDTFGKGPAASNAKHEISRATDKWGESVAVSAKERMAAVLARGHKFNVGASGAASENLVVTHSSSGGAGMSSWEVSEAGRTKSNFFIRRGFRGPKMPKRVPTQNLKEWAADKGVRFKDTSKNPDKFAYYKRTRASSKRRSYLLPVLHKTGMAGGKSVAEAGILGLQVYLARYGSSESHWKSLYPGGSGRFDYVAYVVRKDSSWVQSIRRTGNYTLAAIARWVTTGGSIGERYFADYNWR